MTFWSHMLISAFAFCFLSGTVWSLGCGSDFQLCLCDHRKMASDQKIQWARPPPSPCLHMPPSLTLMPMFGLIGFCSLAQPWSSGQRDVGLMSTTHPAAFCRMEWYFMSAVSILSMVLFSMYLSACSCARALSCLLHFLLSSYLSLYTSKPNVTKGRSALTDLLSSPCIHSSPSQPLPFTKKLYSKAIDGFHIAKFMSNFQSSFFSDHPFLIETISFLTSNLLHSPDASYFFSRYLSLCQLVHGH